MVNDFYKFYKEKMKETTLAIDFDGTLVEDAYPDIGTLKPNAKQVLQRLHDEGYFIIVWTCRGSDDLINTYKFLKDSNVYFDNLNQNSVKDDIIFLPFPKIFANIYIDDRNLGSIPNDWEDIYKLIKKDIHNTIK